MNQCFKPSAWLATIDFVKRLLKNSHLLLVVMSDNRGGKSTFIELLRDKLSNHFEVAILPIAEAERRLALDSTNPHPKPALIIIDDAHLLSIEDLTRLIVAYQEHGPEKNRCLCLTSDFGLTPFLHRFELEGGKPFIHTIEPGALTESEARTYTHKYLQGKKKWESILQPERFKVFYTATQGSLAAMHSQLDLWLAQQDQKEKRIKTLVKKLLINPLVVMSFFLGLGVGVHWFKQPTIEALRPLSVTVQPPVLKSVIPHWYVGINREPISPPPLNQYLELHQEEADRGDDHLVVMDKVVVIPDLTL